MRLLMQKKGQAWHFLKISHCNATVAGSRLLPSSSSSSVCHHEAGFTSARPSLIDAAGFSSSSHSSPLFSAKNILRLALLHKATAFHDAHRTFYSSSGESPPHQVISLPALSRTMAKGNILSWSKKEGEKDVGSFLMQRGCFFMQTRGLKAAPKQMEVILTVDINKVGKAGEIVKVAKGYARNMLIPQLLALPKLDKYVTLVRKQLRAVKAKHPEEETVEEVKESKTEEQRLKELNTVLNRMDTQRVVVRRHTPRQSTEIRTHITPGDIVAEVRRQQKIQIEEINLEMSAFLTALGEYEIPIRLPRDIQIPGGKAKLFLKVKVRRA